MMTSILMTFECFATISRYFSCSEIVPVCECNPISTKGDDMPSEFPGLALLGKQSLLAVVGSGSRVSGSDQAITKGATKTKRLCYVCQNEQCNYASAKN
jgi:hypothetical protein